MWLISEVIKSFDCEKDKGVPIGNLTSQLFANIYLNELDQFVKHKLRVQYYLRYADDLVILDKNKDILEFYLEEIESFLNTNLSLKLHPRKTIFRKLEWGIDFVGYIALPHYELLRTKTKRRIFKKVSVKAQQYKSGVVSKHSFEQTLAPYLGVLKHANTYKVKKVLKEKILAVLLTPLEV